MICNIRETGAVNETDTIKVMSLLDISLFKFYLTGSRYFGGEHKESDWDFFVQDDSMVESFLREHNFTLLDGSGPDLTIYTDDLNIARVFQRENVQVQLVKDVDMKRKVQYLLSRIPNRLYQVAPPHMRKEWWKWGYNILKEMETIV